MCPTRVPSPGAPRGSEPHRRLSELIRAHQAEVVLDWERDARQLSPAAQLDRPALLDDIPELLARIVEMADELSAGKSPPPPSDVAERHALERLEEGFDIADVLLEYALLRDAVLGLWEREELPALGWAELRALNQAIDRAVAESVARYTHARDRAAQALDRVAVATLESATLDELLQQLLGVLVETTPAIDAAAIFMKEGERLRARASVGLDAEAAARFTVAPGEGFVGAIAAERRARSLLDAESGPRATREVMAEPFRSRGVRALHGTPLVDGGGVLGVVCVGTVRAHPLSEQDERLLAVTAARATAAIRQQLAKDAEAARTRELALAVARRQELESIVSSHSDLMYLLDREHRFTYANPAQLALWGKRLDEVLGRTFADVGYPPDVVDLHRAQLDEALTGRTVRGESDLTTSAGHTGHYEYVLVPVVGPDGRVRAVAGTARDITERKRLEDERARALEAETAARHEAESAVAVLDALLATRSVGIAVLDTDLRYVRANEALSAIDGLPPEAHIGRTVRELTPAAPIEPLLAKVLATGEPAVNLELQSAPSPAAVEPRWFLANVFPIRPPSGRTLGVGVVLVEITHQKRALHEREQGLRQLDAEHRWLTAVLDQLPAGVILAEAPGGNITYRNRRAEEIAGRPQGPVERVADYAQLRAWDMAGRELSAADFPLARAMRGESLADEDFILQRPDGGTVTVRSSAGPVRDASGRVVGAVVAFDDITERRRAEEAQRFLQDATRALSESLDLRATLASLARLAVPRMGDWCAIELVTRDGETEEAVVHHVDPTKVALAGELRRRYPPAERGHGVHQVIRSGVPELHATITDDALRAAARDAEHLRLLRALELRSAMTVPMVAHGRRVGAISFVSEEAGRYTPRDVALAQELAARAGQALDNARLFREAQHAVKARDDILAVVSHDLRNPLSAIHMAATLSMQPPGEPRVHKQLETIQRAARRMDHLIGDLLDMASIQAGRLAVHRRPEDGEQLMAEAVDLHEPAARERGLRLVRTCELRGAQLLCDRERVLQVFGNLLGNAVKFCRAGDVVTVSGELVGDEAWFRVSDTGPGIPESELPHVFDPYWSARRHAKKGTGLGLYITKGIVDAHGGRLWAESRPGGGASFTFTLPLADGQPPSSGA